jgi:Uma2 family endonuclease
MVKKKKNFIFVKNFTMTATLTQREYWTLEDLATQYGPIELQRSLSKEEFVAIADHNPNLRMEREPNGNVTIMSPIKRGTSKRESTLNSLIQVWNIYHGNGEVHGSNGTYDLPNGATKMPDISWISPEKLAIEPYDEESYIQTVPDFVAEIRSSTDRLSKLKQKMTESWMSNGVRLAWIIDPYEEKVHIYRQGQEGAEIVEGFTGNVLSGENVLVGFELDLKLMKRKV